MTKKKIIQGGPPKRTHYFLNLIFSKTKKWGFKKRFFPVGRNFGHRLLKKGTESSNLGVPDLEKIFRQTFDENTLTHQITRSLAGARHLLDYIVKPQSTPSLFTPLYTPECTSLYTPLCTPPVYLYVYPLSVYLFWFSDDDENGTKKNKCFCFY